MEKEMKNKNKNRPKLHKSLLYFSKKLKKLPNPTTSPLLSACKHPKTPSFASGRHHAAADNNNQAATLSDVDRFLVENFRSLHLGTGDGHSSVSAHRRHAHGGDTFLQSSSSSALHYDQVDDGDVAAAAEAVAGGSGGGVAVVTFSKEPYDDFLRSMQEMVDARRAVAGAAPAVDWDFMEELLFCYLQLNDRGVHKHILRAFTDTVAGLRRRRRAPARRRRRRNAREDEEEEVVMSS